MGKSQSASVYLSFHPSIDSACWSVLGNEWRQSRHFTTIVADTTSAWSLVIAQPRRPWASYSSPPQRRGRGLRLHPLTSHFTPHTWLSRARLASFKSALATPGWSSPRLIASLLLYSSLLSPPFALRVLFLRSFSSPMTLFPLNSYCSRFSSQIPSRGPHVFTSLLLT